MTPSRRRSRESSSASGGRFDFRGARPGGGKTQSMPAFVQFEHGDRLLHRTLRRRQVTQLRELEVGSTVVRVFKIGELSLSGERFSSEVDGNVMLKVASTFFGL